MSEGLRELLVGSEAERIDRTKGGAEPFAVAIAAILSSQSPEVAAETAAFLREQTELLRAQKTHLEAEHEFFNAERTPRLLALRLRTGLQVFIALFATLIGVGVVILIYSALHSHSLVVDSFEIAPNLAGQVPNGTIVAAGLLDVLTRIQAANRSSVEHRGLSNAWTNEIAINVPETGISIGQIERTLKTRFGHDQHITGDLVQSERGGIALTVRGNGILPKTFTDETRNLGKLVTEAGEYVYGQSQPGLWTAYLSNNDRGDDAIRFAQTAYTTVAPSERPYVLNYWANAIAGKGGDGAMREALRLYQEAIRLKPDFWVGYDNVMYALANLGDEEGVVRVGEKMMKTAGGRPGRAPANTYSNYDVTVWDLSAARAEGIADMDFNGGSGTSAAFAGAENLYIAQLDVQLHDAEAAALRLKTTRVEERNVPDVASAAIGRALLAEEEGNFAMAAREWDTYAAAYANPTVSTTNPQLMCFAAPSYEKTGQVSKADAALNAVGALTFVDCYRFRGDVLEMRGDWAGAQRWYAMAVKLGPSIPSGYYSWGAALARRGDLGGAAAKLREANRTGSHWADPLKVWGDVLAAGGHTKEALAKYDAALKYAPNWRQLKEARETAVKRKN